MKVLLVQLNVSSAWNPLVYPIGLSYVGTALKLKHHDVEILDLNVTQDPLGALREKVGGMEPEIVGLSLKFLSPVPYTSVKQCRQVTKEIKKAGHPRIKILIGGSGFSLSAEKIMEHLPEIDYGILGEGEESTAELLENLEHPENIKGILYRKGEEIIFTGEREKMDFGAFPMPSRDFCDINQYMGGPDILGGYKIGVQTKRGCVEKCIYCAYPHIDGTTLRLRDPEQIVDEIDCLVNSYGVTSIAFTDNVFNIPVDHAERICRNLIKRKIKVNWTAWLHPKYATKEFLELAREAGCNRFEFSPDGFSDLTLKNMGKDMRKKDIFRTYDVIKGMKGIKVRYNFFFWPPGQNLVTLLELICFKLKLKLTFGTRLLKSKLGSIIIDPNTEIHQLAVQQGIIKEDTDLFFSSSLYWPSRWVGMLYKLKEILRETASFSKRIILGCTGKGHRNT
jgi:putative variant cofactor biosynthesis B12-binding/radical SAM domain protein 1